LRAANVRQDEEIRRLIKQAVAAGIRSQDIAEALGISRSTLWRRYADELRQPDDARQHPGLD
jgi:DNA invertase Pin-like site-specific DNA recombinase